MLFTFIGLSSIPLLFSFYAVLRYGVNIPAWDEWKIVGWALSYHEGSFQLQWLLEPHNDGRALFSNLFLLPISILTKINIKIIHFIGYLFYLCAFLLIFFEFRKDTENNLVYLLLLIPVTYYWFNPFYITRFVYNWGGYTYGFLVLMVILTTILLDRSKKSTMLFIFSIFMGFVCSFSGAWGVAIWVSGFFQLILQTTQYKIHKVFLWICSAACTIYIDYVLLEFPKEGIHSSGGYHSYLSTAIQYPVQKFICFLNTLGSQIMGDKQIAVFFGAILVCIFLVIILNNRKKLMIDGFSKWYALLTFWVTSSLLLVLTRSGDIEFSDFGPPDTIFFLPGSRHGPIVFFTIIGVYILALLYCKYSFCQKKPEETQINTHKVNIEPTLIVNIFVFGMIFTLLVLATPLHIMPGFTELNYQYNKGIENQFYLIHHTNMSEEKFKGFYPYPEHIRISIQKIEKYQLNVFSKAERQEFNQLAQFAGGIDITNLSQIPKTTQYNIDSLHTFKNPMKQERVLVNKTENPIITLSGWATDTTHNSLAKGVIVTVDKDIHVPAIYMRSRPDVAQYFNNSALNDSGFWGSINISMLDEGDHTVGIKIISKNKDGYYTSGLINMSVII